MFNHKGLMALEGKVSAGDPRSLASLAENGRRVDDSHVQAQQGAC